MIKNKSFTLIELLVVIVIIGILAGVIIVSTSSSISKANFAKAQAFSNTVQNELLLNLVSEWTFDEGGAEDTWGNNDGTVYGGATYVPKSDNRCVYGGCYSFDGTDDYIDLSSRIDSLGLSKGTLMIWFKTSSFSAQTVFGEGSLVSDWGGLSLGNRTSAYTDESLDFVVISGGTSRLVFFVRKGQKYYADNEWHQFVVVVGDNFNNFYADGEKQILTYGNGTTQTVGNYFFNLLNLDSMAIGRRFYPESPQFFNGLIDDVRIYNSALTTAQIKQEYIAGLNSLLANNNISKEEYNQRIKEIGINY